MDQRRRIIQGAALLGGVAVAAAVAYMLVEEMALLDAIYMVVITLSTVGFSEPTGGLSSAGKFITIWFIVIGVSAAVYTASGVIDLLLDTIGGDRRRRQREVEMIAKLSDHIIVCGYGRVGRRVYDLLAADGFGAVVIELDEEHVEMAREHAVNVIHGDAGRDEFLEAAGIDLAAGVVASVGAEADNLAIVLSARARRPDLYIVARGGDAESRRKLRLAGADRVVAPESAGAERLARLISRRELTEFIEIAAGDARFEFQVEELVVGDQAPFVDGSLAESRIRTDCGVLVLAIHHADGVISAPPSAATRIRAGDVLVSLGTGEQLDRLRSRTRGE